MSQTSQVNTGGGLIALYGVQRGPRAAAMSALVAALAALIIWKRRKQS